jgi:hypothetical protein
MRCCSTVSLVGVPLASPASATCCGGTNVVRDPAGRVGPILGAALACRSMARARIRIIIDESHAAIHDNDSLTFGNTDCTAVERGPETRGSPDRCRQAHRNEAMNNFDLGIGSTLRFSRDASHTMSGIAFDETVIDHRSNFNEFHDAARTRPLQHLEPASRTSS